jgi:trigger factor
LEEQKLDVLGYPDIEEIQFGRGQALQFAATLETAPEFELPEYRGMPVKREIRTVSDEDVARAVDALRQQQLSFKTVERPAQTGDIAVVNYTGTCDGKPITETAPTAKGLTEQKSFWVEMEPGSFIPGFADQLQGAKAGDKRTVQVDFPADFVTPQLAGKKGVYDVELVEVKEKVLPEVDDAFAKSFGAESLEKLREGVRRDLENDQAYSQNKSIRGQLIQSLLNRVNFDLPETAVAQETRNVVYDIVRENQKRGVGRAQIEQDKERIYSAATHGARQGGVPDAEDRGEGEHQGFARGNRAARQHARRHVSNPAGQIHQGPAETQRAHGNLRPGDEREGDGFSPAERVDRGRAAGILAAPRTALTGSGGARPPSAF